MISLSKELGTHLGSRKIAAKFREELLAMPSPVVLDFSGVNVISHSFADELFGKIAEQYGIDIFKDRIILKKLKKEDSAMLRHVVMDRSSKKAS